MIRAPGIPLVGPSGVDMGISSWAVRGFAVLLLVGVGAWAPPADAGGAGRSESIPHDDAGAGMDLTMTPEEAYKLLYTEPNQTKTANLTVTNHAGTNDTVFLDLSVDFRGHPGGVGAGYNGTGWNVWLPKDIIKIIGNWTKTTSVCVRGPKTGECNDYIDVRVIASSTRDPACERNVSFRVYLSFTPKILLTCEDKVHQTSWGGTTYKLDVRNIGPIETGVILNVTGPPDWDCRLDTYCLTLEVNETALVTLTVIPPDFAPMDEVGIVTVTGRSALVPTVKDSVTTHTVACMCPYLEITAEEPEALVDPGETHVFTVLVENSGNLAGSLNVTLSLNLSAPGWNAALSANRVTVAGGESRKANLTVTAPPAALAGSRLVARVIGSTTEPGFSADSMLTVIVNQVHDVGVVFSPQPVGLLPGGAAACDITVRNNGNGEEKLRPEIPEMAQGLAVVLKWPNGTVVGESDWTPMEPGASIGFRAEFAAAGECIAGERCIPALILSSDGNRMPFELYVQVIQVFGVRVRTAEPRQFCAPGGVAGFELDCENTGNGPDNMTITLTGLPAGWPEPEFTGRDDVGGRSILLNPFGQGRLTINVVIPPTALCATHELVATAHSAEGASDTVRLFLDVRLPNLVIAGISYAPKVPTPGHAARITVNISNTGEALAENVTIRFYENNKAMSTEMLRRVPGGAVLTVSFLWVPQTSSKQLRFVVDPDNTVAEYNEADNSAVDCIYRQSPPNPLADWPRIAGVALCALVVAVILATLWKRD